MQYFHSEIGFHWKQQQAYDCVPRFCKTFQRGVRSHLSEGLVQLDISEGRNLWLLWYVPIQFSFPNFVMTVIFDPHEQSIFW